MAKVLSRPMFKRGGNVNSNSGIISGFEKGGNVRQKYAAGDYVQPNYSDILSNYITEPEQQTGLNSSDWLRIAAAGADIMGAPSTGRTGFIGALQAAGPSLSDLGTDLATSRDTRDQNYLTRKSAYDAAMGNAAIQAASDEAGFQRDRIKQEAQFTQDADLFDRGVAHEESMFNKEKTFASQQLQAEFDNAVKLLEKEQELKPYEFEKQYILGEGAKLIETMSRSDITKAEYDEARDAFLYGLHGETMRANQEERANLMMDTDFRKLVSTLTEQTIDSGEIENPDSPYYGKSPSEVNRMIMDELFKSVISQIYVPEFQGRIEQKDGGRIGMNIGGNPNDYEERYREKEGEFVPEPGDEDIEFTFADLRKRLPPEVSDQVIQLIINSEEAMIDFAQLQTPQDIGIFNQKYNTDLQMPTQVA